MAIGLSTYAYFWRLSDRVTKPLNLADAIRRTAQLEVPLFQICDYAPIDAMTDVDLRAIHDIAVDHGVTLELGTKGIRTDHLHRYLRLAQILDVQLLRTMVNSPNHRPHVAEATDLLRAILPDLERQNVTLALETYEQVVTRDLVEIVRTIENSHIRICSDPANTVAALEHPHHVVDAVAPYVVNMHIKDFAFTRTEGLIGFVLTGCPLGEGLLDYDYMVRTINPQARNINQIVEHWLPWQHAEAETLALEEGWTLHSLDFLRSRCECQQNS